MIFKEHFRNGDVPFLRGFLKSFVHNLQSGQMVIRSSTVWLCAAQRLAPASMLAETTFGAARTGGTAALSHLAASQQREQYLLKHVPKNFT